MPISSGLGTPSLLFLLEIVFLSWAYSDDISCFKMFWTFSAKIHGPAPVLANHRLHLCEAQIGGRPLFCFVKCQWQAGHCR